MTTCDPTDILGKKIGRLTVKNITYRKATKGGAIYYVCECECGGVKEVYRSDLRASKVLSCGCYNKDIASSRHTHREGGTRLHRIWGGMVQRCTNPNADSYFNYGGRV